MNRPKKRASSAVKLRSLLFLGGLATAMGATGAAQASVVDARKLLEARVLAVRSAMQDAATPDSAAAPAASLAQWFNWSNWNNWPNWGNWGNWFNR